ncbi:MAG: RdgB/HAM1 family non-canonical purine NTP pyrophosphatase [Planctomycetota bacterium]
MILLGTKNSHKLREVREILEPLGFRVAIAVNLPHVEETGETFADNAALKAKIFASFLRAPVLAEDSGLVVPALGGEPGIRSSRYAGEPTDDLANLNLVLRRIEERGLREPEAYYQCTLALALPGAPERVIMTAEGEVHGRIAAGPRGNGGFGYDPIFFHPESGCTFGELDPDAKNRISHRANALKELARRLPEVAFELDL